MTQTIPSFRIGAVLHGRGGPWAVALAALLGGGPAARPGTGAGFESLGQVESAAETRDYTQQIRDNTFADPQRDFLTKILLPQLAKQDNRATIPRTRQRIRELALRDAAKDVFEPVNTLLRDTMARQAADKQAEPTVRVNAMLMVGELVIADGKPWPGAVATLADAVADASLPLEVRIAALVGLGRHIGENRQGAEAITTTAGPAVAGLLQSPPEGDPVAVRWLTARALELLPAVAPPPAILAVVAGLLADEKADADLRVRAAMALGKLAGPDAGIDAMAAVVQVRDLAITALEADLAAAATRRFDRKISGRPEAGMNRPTEAAAPAQNPGSGGGATGGGGLAQAVDEDAVPTLACRRNAWRLFVLANAIRPARSGPGLADLIDKDALPASDDLATTLRQAALELDSQPDEKILEEALASIRRVASPDRPQANRGAAEPTPGGRPKPASPFDPPAEASPF